MGSVTGKTRVEVGDREYTLFLGFSGLAEMQERHGQDFLQKLMPPKGSSDGWMPKMQIIVDLIMESLQRFHADEADKYLVDDILAADGDVVGQLVDTSFGGDETGKAISSGNAKGPGKNTKRAATKRP